MGYIYEDLNWDMKRLGKPFTKLLEEVFIKYDTATKVVLVINYLKNNPIENENQAKAAIKQVVELPKTELLQDVKRFLERLDKPFMKRLVEQIPKPVTVTVTVTVTEAVTVTKDSPSPDGSEGVPKMSKAEMFNQFWEAYPKRKSKGDAEKAWAKIKMTESLLAEILDSIEKGKQSHEWTKEGGQYIPYPATWLNRKGWEDEYTQVENVPDAWHEIRKFGRDE
jgi:hypothetical protein